MTADRRIPNIPLAVICGCAILVYFALIFGLVIGGSWAISHLAKLVFGN